MQFQKLIKPWSPPCAALYDLWNLNIFDNQWVSRDGTVFMEIFFKDTTKYTMRAIPRSRVFPSTSDRPPASWRIIMLRSGPFRTTATWQAQIRQESRRKIRRPTNYLRTMSSDHRQTRFRNFDPFTMCRSQDKGHSAPSLMCGVSALLIRALGLHKRGQPQNTKHELA
jgi:hypothetical protein